MVGGFNKTRGCTSSKYLIFFANEYLKFTCMSNGCGPAMKIFTKVPFSVIRMQGHISVVFVADLTYMETLMKVVA